MVKQNFEFFSKETEILNFRSQNTMILNLSFFFFLFFICCFFRENILEFLLEIMILKKKKKSPGKLKSGIVFLMFELSRSKKIVRCVIYVFIFSVLGCSVWLLRNCSICLLRQT